jgi:hypothetical protein
MAQPILAKSAVWRDQAMTGEADVVPASVSGAELRPLRHQHQERAAHHLASTLLHPEL